jgi:uncharacterized protein YoxC
METVLIICAVLFTVAVLVIAVFLVMMLIQARRTAHEAEALLKNLNEEMAVIKKVTGILSSISENFNSPVFKIGSMAAKFITTMFKKKSGASEE